MRFVHPADIKRFDASRSAFIQTIGTLSHRHQMPKPNTIYKTDDNGSMHPHVVCGTASTQPTPAASFHGTFSLRAGRAIVLRTGGSINVRRKLPEHSNNIIIHYRQDSLANYASHQEVEYVPNCRAVRGGVKACNEQTGRHADSLCLASQE